MTDITHFTQSREAGLGWGFIIRTLHSNKVSAHIGRNMYYRNLIKYLIHIRNYNTRLGCLWPSYEGRLYNIFLVSEIPVPSWFILYNYCVIVEEHC